MSIITHNETTSYAASGFANRIGWGNSPALVLIDVCTAYWTEGSPLNTLSNPASAAAPDSMRALLAAARESKVPVIWTRCDYECEDMSDAGIFWMKTKALSVWQRGDTRGYDKWMPGLEPGKREVEICKKYPSAFFGTDLSTRLRVLGVDTLVMCGVSTSGCIRATTLDGMQNGFRVMVVGSACGDRSPEIHNANMFDMDAKMADAVSEEEAVEKLRAGKTKA